MKVLDFFFTISGGTVRLEESGLTDDSKVYDIRVIDRQIEQDLVISPYSKEDANRRFELLRKALVA